MTTTLLTFLGRVPKSENGYRKTCYEFDDGRRTEPVAFFGWPLQNRISAERLVIMGTAGSMWDHLFESDIAFGQEGEDARIKLMEAVEIKAVSAGLLVPVERLLSERLGCEARLVLIPYCRNERDQVELLDIMAKHVARGDTVHIDVSHGFRHLPMICILAALHLRVARQAKIGGIWYGAFDPDTNEAPVYNLVGLLRIADWLEALHSYDKDGDYGAFRPLLGPAGDLLVRAAFFERTSNPVKAREALSGWASRQDRFPRGDPAAELFRDELEQRVCWYRQPDRASWEKELAQRYLEQGDFVRAAIYGLEAVISASVARSGGSVHDFDQRDTAREELKSTREGFRTLNNLRNALAHGVRPWDSRIEGALRDEANLRTTLKSLLTQLLASQRKQGP
jgi:CRISPR-associated Csx2 family protein